MFCGQCGAEITEGAKFCASCGNPVEAKIIKEDIPEPLAEEPTLNEEFVTEEPLAKVSDAVEPATESTPITETVQKPLPENTPVVKGKKGKAFAGALLSVLCSVMIFVFSFSALTLFIARESLAEEKVTKMVENIDVKALMEEGGLDYYIDAKPKDAAKIFRKTPIGSYVKDLVLQYTEYLRGGKEPEGIDADELTTLIGENAYEIEEITGRRITNRDYREIQKYFGEESEELIGVLSSSVRTNQYLKTIRFFLSTYVIIGLVLLALVFVFLLLKVRKFSLDTLIWTAVPVLFATLIITVFGTIQPLTLMMVAELGDVVGIIVKTVMGNILQTVLTGGAIGFGVGIVLIASYVIAKRVKFGNQIAK